MHKIHARNAANCNADGISRGYFLRFGDREQEHLCKQRKGGANGMSGRQCIFPDRLLSLRLSLLGSVFGVLKRFDVYADV